MKRSQPHGLEMGFQTEVLNEGRKSKSLKSKLEAYVQITNSLNDKVVVMPMRSFVNNFITAFRGYMHSGTNPAINCAVRSVSNNGAGIFGMFLGTGTNVVQLSDTALQTKASSASMTHGVTSFVAPSPDLPIYPSGAAPSGEPIFEGLDDGSSSLPGAGKTPSLPGITRTKVRRVFTNALGITFNVAELGLIAKASSAVGVKLLSRDLLPSNPGAPAGVGVPAGGAVTFTFEFTLSQAANGYGGALLNLSRLVYNFLLKGNQNDQPILDTTSSGITLTFPASIGATLGASTALQVNSAASTYYGIVVGRYNAADTSGKTAAISPGDTTFVVDHTGLTVGACTVSSISNPYSNAAQFTITRDFTNNTTTSIYLDRIGLINRGAPSNAGASLLTTQMFYAINKPSGGYIELQPAQTLRVTYTFGIQV